MYHWWYKKAKVSFSTLDIFKILNTSELWLGMSRNEKDFVALVINNLNGVFKPFVTSLNTIANATRLSLDKLRGMLL